MAEDASPVRLLHITTVPESLGFLAGQAGYMRARGFEVHVMSSPGDMLHSFAAEEGVIAHPVDMPRRISPGSDLRAVAAIRATMRAMRPHIVHAHTPKGGLLGTLAARFAGVPVRIYHIHGTPFLTAQGARRALLLASEVCACRAASRVLCVSQSVRELVVSKRLCPGRKAGVLRGGTINGIDSEQRFNPDRMDPQTGVWTRKRLGIPPDAVVIGFIGRVVRDKGLVELVDAWRSLRHNSPRVHMLIVGPFEPQDPVPPDVEKTLRSDPRIHLTGLDWETPRLYAAMDMVVLPSYREGFPSVPLEAGAMRLPVVATRVPGCVDAVVDCETGMLVPPRDALALGLALRTYLDDQGLRDRHGAAGRERVVRDFRREDVHRALHEEYLRLLALAGLGEPTAAARTGTEAGMWS